MKRVSLIFAALLMTSAAAVAASVDVPGGLGLTVDEFTGSYELTAKDIGWTFAGKVANHMTNLATQDIKDDVGTGKEISFSYVDATEKPVNASIRGPVAPIQIKGSLRCIPG